MGRIDGEVKTALIRSLQANGAQLSDILATIDAITNGTGAKNEETGPRAFTNLERYILIVLKRHFFRPKLESLFDSYEELELFLKKMDVGKLTDEEIEMLRPICEQYLISIFTQAIMSMKIEQQEGEILVTMDRG